MKVILAFFATFMIALLIVAGGFITSYNNLITNDNNISQYQANVSTQLQRRADLIPNLVNTVKAYTKHESTVFTEIAKSREKLLAASSVKELNEANNAVTASLGKLLVIAEGYPELKSDKVYIGLMDELAGTENRISYARDKYNTAVGEYNKAIKVIPNVFMANMMGLTEKEFFTVSEKAKEVPQVNFE